MTFNIVRVNISIIAVIILILQPLPPSLLGNVKSVLKVDKRSILTIRKKQWERRNGKESDNNEMSKM